MSETERLPLRRCRVEDRAAGAWLEAACVAAGEDLVVVVGGGQRPHVGAAALAISVPSAVDPAARTCSSYLASVPGHREEDLARDGALRLSRALRRQVVVTVGIHDDAIPRERIAAYLELFERLLDQVEAAHAAPPGG
jgi:gallate decarboxylase subunit D